MYVYEIICIFYILIKKESQGLIFAPRDALAKEAGPHSQGGLCHVEVA